MINTSTMKQIGKRTEKPTTARLDRSNPQADMTMSHSCVSVGEPVAQSTLDNDHQIRRNGKQ